MAFVETIFPYLKRALVDDRLNALNKTTSTAT